MPTADTYNTVSVVYSFLKIHILYTEVSLSKALILEIFLYSQIIRVYSNECEVARDSS